MFLEILANEIPIPSHYNAHKDFEIHHPIFYGPFQPPDRFKKGYTAFGEPAEKDCRTSFLDLTAFSVIEMTDRYLRYGARRILLVSEDTGDFDPNTGKPIWFLNLHEGPCENKMFWVDPRKANASFHASVKSEALLSCFNAHYQHSFHSLQQDAMLEETSFSSQVADLLTERAEWFRITDELGDETLINLSALLAFNYRSVGGKEEVEFELAPSRYQSKLGSRPHRRYSFTKELPLGTIDALKSKWIEFKCA